jgi:hypothetical protein
MTSSVRFAKLPGQMEIAHKLKISKIHELVASKDREEKDEPAFGAGLLSDLPVNTWVDLKLSHMRFEVPTVCDGNRRFFRYGDCGTNH